MPAPCHSRLLLLERTVPACVTKKHYVCPRIPETISVPLVIPHSDGFSIIHRLACVPHERLRKFVYHEISQLNGSEVPGTWYNTVTTVEHCNSNTPIRDETAIEGMCVRMFYIAL
jgi:hypothetical protein